MFLAGLARLAGTGSRHDISGSNIPVRMVGTIAGCYLVTRLRHELFLHILLRSSSKVDWRCRVLLCIFCLIAPVSGAISAQTALLQGKPGSVPTPHLLAAGKSVEVSLQPKGSVDFAVPLHAGGYSEIHVRQIQGMTLSELIDPDGHAHTPRTNDGGIGSVERISIIPTESGEFHLRVYSREWHTPVQFQVELLPERTPQARDGDRILGESFLARAELRRRKPNTVASVHLRTTADVLAAYSKAFHLGVRAEDIALQRQALVGEARFMIFRAGMYQQGVQVATRATQVPATTPDIGQQALAWKTLASALAFVDRYNESIAASNRALTLYTQNNDLYWQGIVLGNLADTYQQIGDSTKALESVDAAHRIAEKLRDDYGIAYTDMSAGEIDQGRGKYQQALDAYDRALDTVAVTPYPQVEAEVRSDRGELYSQLGDWEQASSAYRQALPMLETDGDTINEIEALGHLGDLALHIGHSQQAEDFFLKGLRLATSQKLIREQTRLEVGLARTCMQITCVTHHATVDPMAILSQAMIAAVRIDQVDGEAAIDGTMGDVLAAKHEDAAAMRMYVLSGDLWKQIPNQDEIAAAEASMARIDFRDHHLLAALQHIDQGLDAVERSRASLQSDLLRTSYFSSKHDYYDLAIQILMQLDQERPGHGYAMEAWEVAERARARTLLDVLEEGSGAKPFNTNAAFQQKYAALQFELRNAEDQQLRLGSSVSDVLRGRNLERKIHGILLGLNQMSTSAMQENARHSGKVGVNVIAASSFSRTILNNQTALLEYWMGNRHSYMWLISRDHTQHYSLPASEQLTREIQEFKHWMLARDEFVAGEDIAGRQQRVERADAALRKTSWRLATVLLPGQFSARIHRLIIVPDGDLFSLPFAALELPPGHPGSPVYLVQHYDLVYEPSASTIGALLKENAHLTVENRVAVFADPVYSSIDSRVHLDLSTTMPQSSAPAFHRTAFEDTMMFPRLPASATEALAIEKIAGVERTSMYLGFSASPEQVEEIHWSSYSVAHFATHAIVNTKRQDLSGIVLSMVHRNGAPADGILWLHDIYGLHMPVSLVTLSGCQTADGESIPGEGVNGLARAFLFSGASSVVGTLWNVEDESSNELMQRLYRSLFNLHMGTSDALRSAQLSLLSNPKYAPPYYWAGVVLEGTWQRQ